MKIDRLESMVRGWFVGPFEPSVLKTESCEVSIRRYKAGDKEAAHYHRVATEITVIVEGEARMCGKTLTAGDIVTLNPCDVADFEAIDDLLTVVVKVPGAKHDKFIV
jgi:hypothetical protein